MVNDANGKIYMICPNVEYEEGETTTRAERLFDPSMASHQFYQTISKMVQKLRGCIGQPSSRWLDGKYKMAILFSKK